MNRHLSSERISQWLLGQRSAEDERHMRECAACAAEVARLESALGEFRGSLRTWSEREMVRVPDAGWAAPQRRFWSWGMRLAAVAALLLLAVLVPVYRGTHPAHLGAAIAQADAQLLEEVDAGVSRAVPEPMEPLLTLMAWDSGNAADTTGKESDESTQQK